MSHFELQIADSLHINKYIHILQWQLDSKNIETKPNILILIILYTTFQNKGR